MKEKSQHETRKTLGDKEGKMTLSSGDMAKAHVLKLWKGTDLVFSLQLSSICMYENKITSALESFSLSKVIHKS